MKIECYLTKIYSFFMIIALVSFLGFMVENIWLAITKGYMDNRNMVFPMLLGYGLAIVALYAMFGTPHAPRFLWMKIQTGKAVIDALIYFGIVFVCISLGEYILGTFVEKTSGIVWWNYSRIPLHISKYTSIPTSTGFSILISVFMRYFFMPLLEHFSKMNDHLLGVLAISFMSLMVIDFVYSAAWMYKNGTLMQLWKLDFTNTRAYKFFHVMNRG